MKPFVNAIVFGSIFISLCAVAMCIETNLLLQLPLNKISFYLFVFCATLLQYNAHYYIKKSANNYSHRFTWSRQHRSLHRVFMGIGIVGIIISLNFFTLKHFFVLATVALGSVLYSFPFLPFKNKKRLKDFGLLKIAMLSYIWTLVTVWFPVVNIGAVTPSFMLVFAMRFVFLFVLCLAFDIRDIVIDGRENIQTLPVMIGARNCYLLIYLSLILMVGAAIWYFYLQQQFMFLNAIILSAMLTYLVVEYSRRHHNDMVYLAGIDGMMLLQAVLVALGTL